MWLMEVNLTADRERSIEEARAFYRRVLHALDDLDVIDPDFTGELQRGPFSFTFVVDLDEIGDVLKHGLTRMRTALHAAGGSTVGWPHCDDLPDPVEVEDGWIVRFEGTSQRPTPATPALASH